MSLPRCEIHNIPIFKGQTECYRCAKARETPEEREASRQMFRRIVEEILPFAEKLKARMLKLNKASVRIECPNKNHSETTYIVARIAGSRNHLHFACSDETCHYRMME